MIVQRSPDDSPATSPPPANPAAAPAAKTSPRPLYMRLLGIRARKGRWLRYAPTRWGWFLLFFFSFVGGSVAFFEYSMQPDFCRSCHLMEPYYQAWHTSTHKDVPCVQCHFEPGFENTLKGKFEASAQAVKFITGTYGSKPHAQIADASCMRSGCHERRLLEGKVDWTVQTVRGGSITIKFDHTPHLTELRRGKQLRCVSCHSQIVQGQHLVVTVDTCFNCHMKGFEHGRYEETMGGCRACHEAPKTDIRLATGLFSHSEFLERGVSCENCHSDVIRGDGAVARQTCWTCHNREDQVARYNDPTFLHTQHITTKKVECQSCHQQIIHNINAAQLDSARQAPRRHTALDPASCGGCHEMTHAGPQELYEGRSARGIPDMPSPMFRAQVDCIACHRTRKVQGAEAAIAGQTFVAAKDSCEYCHGSKHAGTLDTWRQQIQEHLQRARQRLDETRAAMLAASLTPVHRLAADRLLDDAAHNIRLVQLGHGVHNFNYATAALNHSIECCTKAAQVLSSTAATGPPTTQPTP